MKSVAKTGEALTVDYCQCCKQQQPDGTLNLIGFRAYCNACLLHPEGTCKEEPDA